MKTEEEIREAITRAVGGLYISIGSNWQADFDVDCCGVAITAEENPQNHDTLMGDFVDDLVGAIMKVCK